MRSHLYLGVIVIVVLLLAAGLYSVRPTPVPSAEIAAVPSQETLPTDNTLPYPPNSQLEMADIDPIDRDVQVTLKTSQGDIQLTLHGAAAPVTVGNFVKLAQDNFYDGTTFHRVIPDFMIQGGDPLSKDATQRAIHGTGDPGYKFEDEINTRPMLRGSIAMANSGPNTNGSQFFIVTGPEFPHLQPLHTNFGEVTSGMEIVDAISKVPADQADNPTTPVVIQDVVVVDAQN